MVHCSVVKVATESHCQLVEHGRSSPGACVGLAHRLLARRPAPARPLHTRRRYCTICYGCGPPRHFGIRPARRAAARARLLHRRRGACACCRHPRPRADRTLNGLAGIALRFLNDAQALGGACRNRMDSTGDWVDEPALEDAWGRCIWGPGPRPRTAMSPGRVSRPSCSSSVPLRRGPSGRERSFAAPGAADYSRSTRSTAGAPR